MVVEGGGASVFGWQTKGGGGVGPTGQVATRCFDHSGLLYCIIVSFGGYVTGVDPFFFVRNSLSGGNRRTALSVCNRFYLS